MRAGAPRDPDLAPVGLVEAEEDRHQRRLAGAVLADDAVDRALPDGKRHVLVGVNRTEALVDADEFDGGGHEWPAFAGNQNSVTRKACRSGWDQAADSPPLGPEVTLSPAQRGERARSWLLHRAGIVGGVVVHLDSCRR